MRTLEIFAATVLFAIAHPQLALAAQPSIEWVATGGGDKNDKTRAINVDREGNVFLAGEMTGDGKFGDIEVKSAGGMDFFVAKLDPKGHFLWAHSLGGSLIDRGYGVACDAAGNAYVTGHYQSTDVMVEGKALPNAGDYDIFVAKYDRDGRQLWVRTAGGKGYDYGHGIAVDNHGDIVVTGAVVGDSHFGEVEVPNAPGSHVFCAKYDSGGKLLWVKTSNTTGKSSSNNGHGIITDAQNNIYIGGACSGTAQFGGKEMSLAKGQAAFVLKLNAQGEAQWVSTAAGEPSCLVHEITADASGRVWVAGMFKGKATFGSETFTTTGDKDSDAFIAHYDTEGELQWVRVGQGPAIDYGLGVTTDGKGHSFLTGEFMETFKLAGGTLQSRGATDIYLAGFDPKGTLEWLTQVGGPKGDNAYTMVCDPTGALLFAGACVGPADFGDKKVEATRNADAYGAKLRMK